MNDFVSIVQKNLGKILEIDGTDKEILFVEKNPESESLLIYQREKLSLDLEGKELIIFLLQQPDDYKEDKGDIQTVALPEFDYTFNPSKPKAMGQKNN